MSMAAGMDGIPLTLIGLLGLSSENRELTNTIALLIYFLVYHLVYSTSIGTRLNPYLLQKISH